MVTTYLGFISTQTVSIVMQEVVRLVPIVLPVAIGFIGLRKGISFLKNSLRGA